MDNRIERIGNINNLWYDIDFPQVIEERKKYYSQSDNYFIVTKGEAKILSGEEEIVLKENESYLVRGEIPHSVWNNHSEETIMIGISVK